MMELTGVLIKRAEGMKLGVYGGVQYEGSGLEPKTFVLKRGRGLLHVVEVPFDDSTAWRLPIGQAALRADEPGKYTGEFGLRKSRLDRLGRQGIMHTAMRALIGDAINDGLQTAEFSVAPDNVEAVGLVTKLGAKLSERNDLNRIYTVTAADFLAAEAGWRQQNV